MYVSTQNPMYRIGHRVWWFFYIQGDSLETFCSSWLTLTSSQSPPLIDPWLIHSTFTKIRYSNFYIKHWLYMRIQVFVVSRLRFWCGSFACVSSVIACKTQESFECRWTVLTVSQKCGCIFGAVKRFISARKCSHFYIKNFKMV